MKSFVVLMDVSPDPVGSLGVLILLLGIIFTVAMAFAGGLVFLLIRLKRRKMKSVGTGTETVIG